MRRSHVLLMAVLVLPVPSSCKAAPRARPVELGPVDTGPASVEAVRRQLLGTWELIEFEVFSPTGERIEAQATGRLQYDEFGNLSMRGTLTGGPQVDSSVLNLTGRAVIDPVTRMLRFAAIAAATADDKRIDPKLDPTHVRYYEFDGDLLKTTVKAADGATTATATWKRIN